MYFSQAVVIILVLRARDVIKIKHVAGWGRDCNARDDLPRRDEIAFTHKDFFESAGRLFRDVELNHFDPPVAARNTVIRPFAVLLPGVTSDGTE